MNPRRHHHRRVLAALGPALIAVAGCGGAGGQSAATPSASPAPDTRAAWTEAAKCIRANGAPDFPDPVPDDNGRWSIPEIADPPPVPPACADLFRKAKLASQDGEAPTAEQMNKLREYAACMRDRGVPDHPDPDGDGNFGVPEAMEHDPAYRSAYDACQRYLPPLPPK